MIKLLGQDVHVKSNQVWCLTADIKFYLTLIDGLLSNVKQFNGVENFNIICLIFN